MAIEWNPDKDRMRDDAVGCIKDGDGEAVGVLSPVDGRSDDGLNGVNDFVIGRPVRTVGRSLLSTVLIGSSREQQRRITL